jgi:hypothetical protein
MKKSIINLPGIMGVNPENDNFDFKIEVIQYTREKTLLLRCSILEDRVAFYMEQLKELHILFFSQLK